MLIIKVRPVGPVCISVSTNASKLSSAVTVTDSLPVCRTSRLSEPLSTMVSKSTMARCSLATRPEPLTLAAWPWVALSTNARNKMNAGATLLGARKKRGHEVNMLLLLGLDR